MSASIPLSKAVLSALSAAFEELAFCIRIVLDSLSDLTFQILLNGRGSAGMCGFRGVPPLCGEHRALLLMPAAQLAKKIRNREITAEQLVVACLSRISEIQPLLNCVAAHRFAAALEDARRVDRIIASVSPTSPDAMLELAKETPLLGVPFSAEEGIRVHGLPHTCGVPSSPRSVAPSDSDAVRRLREAGAIPLCVTNGSELGLWWGEASNAVYGTTRNPYDTRRSPGGSSGGECALQSCAGVPLSLCSDSMGSLRTSAHFCGLFAHKVSPGLVSVRGARALGDPSPGHVSQTQSIGTASRHFVDVMAALKVLLGERYEKLQLHREVSVSRLRFFLLDSPIGNRFVSPVGPDLRQALSRVANFLEDNYCVVVRPIRIDALADAVSLSWRGAERDYGAISEGKVIRTLKERHDEGSHPGLLLEWLWWFMMRSNHSLPVLVAATAEKAVDTMATTKNRLGYTNTDSTTGLTSHCPVEVESLKRQLQNLLGTDGVLLCPPHPTCAPFLHQSYTKPLNFVYAAVFSALGMPVTEVPLGMGASGMPLGVQIVASPMQDRLCLAVAQALERPFGGWTPPFRENEELFYY